MPLPKIDHPIYEVYLKSLDRKVKFRPFLVKEEKLLLMAKESDDVEEVVKTIRQIIVNCCVDNINIDDLPTFDVEMFFIHLRMQSVGSLAELVYTCNNVNTEQNTCNTKIEFALDLNNVKYHFEEGHSDTIKLNESVGVKFKYPSLNIPKSLLDDKLEETGYGIILEYIDYIYDKEQVYKAKDFTKEELLTFLDGLTLEQVRSVKNFFLTSPKVVLEQKVTCPKCAYVHDVNVEGILSFFD